MIVSFLFARSYFYLINLYIPTFAYEFNGYKEQFDLLPEGDLLKSFVKILCLISELRTIVFSKQSGNLTLLSAKYLNQIPGLEEFLISLLHLLVPGCFCLLVQDNTLNKTEPD